MNKNSVVLNKYFIESEGKEIYIEESLRFLLHDPHSLLLIQEGTLDIFALNLQGEMLFKNKDQVDDLALNTTPFIAELLEGTLVYLGSLSQGKLLFPFPICSELDKLRIIAIAITPLKLKKLSFRIVQNDLKTHLALRNEVSKQVDDWVHIFDPVLNLENGSKLFNVTPLELHMTQQLPIGTKICHSRVGRAQEKHTLIWAQSLQGNLGVEIPSIHDKQYSTIRPFAPPFPVTQNLVLHCLNECEVTSFALEDVVKKNLLMWSILCFHQIILHCLTAAAKKKEVTEVSHFKQRAVLDNELLENTLRGASQILETPEHALISPSQDPLVKAFDWIGEKQQIKFLHPPHPTDLSDLEERISKICSYSHVNFRKVFFENKWWHQTEGIFLCFDKNNQPRIVQCKVENQSTLIDPKDFSKIPLNQMTVKELKSTGYVFYRNFPDKSSLSFWDLIHFVFLNKGNEIRTILFSGFLAVLVSLFIPFATSIIFDQVIPHHDSSLLLQITLGMFISVISTALFQLAKEYTITRMLTIIDMQLMVATWDRVLNLKANFFRKYEIGDLFLRIQGINEMAKKVAGSPLRILLNTLFSLLYLAAMFYYSPGLTLVGLVVMGTMILITLLFILKNIPIQKQIIDIKGFTNSKVIEIIQAITKVRTSGIGKRMFSFWLQNFTLAKNLEKKQLTTQNIILTLLSLAPNLVYFLILTVIIYTLSYQQPGAPSYLSVGALMAFLAAYAPFSESVFESLTTLMELQILKPLWDRVKGILNEPIEYDTSKIKLASISGAIRFEQVSFRYSPEAPLVLKEISFEVKPGEFVGIVGLSGSGKSTLIRLITGLEIPEKGDIFIDNHSIKSIDLRDFRKRIGTVLQQSFILSGSIREFLSGGRSYPDEKLLHALHEAGFEKDLQNLPMGLETVLVNGAGTFSGGQRQRLILAKALVTDPKILLLDEATSALDNQTQELVKTNLDMQQITRVVVAHRLSTVRMADRIYVIDEGKIVDQGTFEELSDKLGLFAELLAKQKG